MANPFRSSSPVVPVRCVHLDLKGFPPTPQRLEGLLRVFAAARFNAVLVEWEDSFPWTVDEWFRSETAYAPEQVRAFAARAAELGIEVIPLVQCLGHMETALRPDAFVPVPARGKVAPGGVPAAYVCRAFTCSPPVEDPSRLRADLSAAP